MDNETAVDSHYYIYTHTPTRSHAIHANLWRDHGIHRDMAPPSRVAESLLRGTGYPTVWITDLQFINGYGSAQGSTRVVLRLHPWVHILFPLIVV